MNQIIFGVHAVYEALRQRPQDVYQLVVMEDRQSRNIEKVISLAKQKKCPIEVKPKKSFERWLSQSVKGDVETHQGIAVQARPKKILEISDLKSMVESKARLFIFILDHLEDPHNFGALLRSAACAGVDVVVYPRQGAVGLSPTVYKISAGGIEHVSLCRVVNIHTLLNQLKAWNVQCVGLDMKAKKTIYALETVFLKCALVVGSEETGLQHNVLQSCDEVVRIPMSQKLDSLNASVAGAIGLFELLHRRETS